MHVRKDKYVVQASMCCGELESNRIVVTKLILVLSRTVRTVQRSDVRYLL